MTVGNICHLTQVCQFLLSACNQPAWLSHPPAAFPIACCSCLCLAAAPAHRRQILPLTRYGFLLLPGSWLPRRSHPAVIPSLSLPRCPAPRPSPFPACPPCPLPITEPSLLASPCPRGGLARPFRAPPSWAGGKSRPALTKA